MSGMSSPLEPHRKKTAEFDAPGVDTPLLRSVASMRRRLNPEGDAAICTEDRDTVYFCLTLQNPFWAENPEGDHRTHPHESNFTGYAATEKDPAAFMLDSDFLLFAESGSGGDEEDEKVADQEGGPKKHVKRRTRSNTLFDHRLPFGRESKNQNHIPTPTQKLIALLRRMRARGIQFEPADILCEEGDNNSCEASSEEPIASEDEEERSEKPADVFLATNGPNGENTGLQQKVVQIQTSPRKTPSPIQAEDELLKTSQVSQKSNQATAQGDYIFHGYYIDQTKLLISPDKDEIYILIHCPRSTLCGFAERQGVRFGTNPLSSAGGGPMVYSEEEDVRLAYSAAVYLSRNPQAAHDDYLDSNGKPWGFRVEIPQQMRLLVRMLREGWEYGGCGFPMYELRGKEQFVAGFFPLHNTAAMEELGIVEWAKLRTTFSKRALQPMRSPLVDYFGEDVALYFAWIRNFTVGMIPLAIAGVICGILDKVLEEDASIFNAAFGFLVVCWSVWWNLWWRKEEKVFDHQLAQSIEEEGAAVRDEFKPAGKCEISISRLFELKFDHPLTVRRLLDGTLLELHSSNRKRRLLRAFLTYPCVALLTIAMLVAVGVVTYYRIELGLKETGDVHLLIDFAASIVTVITTVGFGKLFEVVCVKLNALENNRTDEEEQTQYIYKGFFFYFWSNYFAMLALAMWPHEGTNRSRRTQLATQMFTQTVVLPLVQNIQEITIPYASANFRRRRDHLGGSTCQTIKSYLCCRAAPAEPTAVTSQEKEAKRLWYSASKEEYGSTTQDYLEITLQFGYMAMFGAIFPWAPLAAVVYNIFEIRVDANKLIKFYQRPIPTTADSIGPWNTLFALLSILSIFSNSYIIAYLYPTAQQLGIDGKGVWSWTDRSDQHQQKAAGGVNGVVGNGMGSPLSFFMCVQYAMFIVSVLLVFFVGTGNPTRVEKMLTKQKILSERAVFQRLMKRLDDQRKAGVDEISVQH